MDVIVKPNRRRILIVEDDVKLSEQYQAIVQPEFEVDAVFDLDQALLQIDRKTYHVALVDIMLAGSDNALDRGGVDVVSRLHELDEGTQVIVLSGTKDIEIPLEVLLKYHVFTYIRKQKVRSSADLVTPIQDALRSSLGLKVFGRFASLLSYLAYGHGGEIFWVDQALRILKSLDGYGGLNVFVSEFFGVFAPLLPLRGAKLVSDFDLSAQTLEAHLWSKAVGGPVWLFARHSLGMKDVSPPKPEGTGRLIWHDDRWAVEGWGYLMEEPSRKNFIDRMDELPAQMR